MSSVHLLKGFNPVTLLLEVFNEQPTPKQFPIHKQKSSHFSLCQYLFGTQGKYQLTRF